jgi:hypothetical protein
MQARAIFHTALLPAIVAGAPTARGLTQDELMARIQAAGYSQVSDVKTAEGTTARAVKNGRPARLVVESGGQIKEQK